METREGTTPPLKPRERLSALDGEPAAGRASSHDLGSPTAAMQAARFVAHPSVADMPRAEMRLFLRRKGLHDTDIDRAFALEEVGPRAKPGSAVAQISASTTAAASLAPARRSRLGAVLLALLAVAGGFVLFRLLLALAMRLRRRYPRLRVQPPAPPARQLVRAEGGQVEGQPAAAGVGAQSGLPSDNEGFATRIALASQGDGDLAPGSEEHAHLSEALERVVGCVQAECSQAGAAVGDAHRLTLGTLRVYLHNALSSPARSVNPARINTSSVQFARIASAPVEQFLSAAGLERSTDGVHLLLPAHTADAPQATAARAKLHAARALVQARLSQGEHLDFASPAFGGRHS